MTEDDFPVMLERCATCAYRTGTEANRSYNTRLKAQLCLETGERFLCHEDPNRIALCKGWADALTARHEKGIGFESCDWKLEMKRNLADLIVRFEDAENAGVPFDVVAEIRKTVLGDNCI